MTRLEELYRDSADFAWDQATQLAREKLLRERRYLPQFLTAPKAPPAPAG